MDKSGSRGLPADICATWLSRTSVAGDWRRLTHLSGVGGQLTPSHLRALAVVPSVADRAELAVRALEQTWTVDKTEAEVAQFRQRHGLGGKGGRPPLPAVVKRAGALQRAAKALGKKPDFKDLDVKARAQLRKDLESARAVLDAWLAGF